MNALCAPITITITGRTAAALRFVALVDGTSAERYATTAVRDNIACIIGEIAYNMGGGEEDGDRAVKSWLSKKGPRARTQ